jgi:hypothetical protein
LNKKELASRVASTHYERFVNNMGKRPDMSAAVKVGEPTLVDPKETDAPNIVREINSIVKAETEAKSGTGKVAVEAVSESGKIPANQPAPRSAEAAVNPSDVPAQAPTQLNESTSGSTDAAASDSSSTSTSAANDDPKNAASSRKTKKKHHFKIPIPF